ALKSNEQVASSFGMSPVFFKLAGFVLAGALAGLGGGLLAFAQLGASAQDFTFSVALTYVIMVVIGGLGSRTGVVIGSVITAYLGHWLETIGRVLEETGWPVVTFIGEQVPVAKLALFGALLLLTITFFPGGIAQQIKPITTWLSGKPFPRTNRRGGRRARRAEVYAGMEAPDPSASVTQTVEEE
ncbi:MAG: ABC transporter permease subunit, partial [Acidimicrobiia bacterium]